MTPWELVINTVSADCSTARDSFLRDSSALCCSTCRQCRATVFLIGRTSVAPSRRDFARQFHVPDPMVSATVLSSASSVSRMKGTERPS